MPDQTHPPLPSSIDETIAMLGDQDYLAGRALGTVLFLALKMKRPGLYAALAKLPMTGARITVNLYDIMFVVGKRRPA